MYANYMTNPYYDWPMDYHTLNKFVAKKYSDINGIHHYEDVDGYEVDSDASGATAVNPSRAILRVTSSIWGFNPLFS